MKRALIVALLLAASAARAELDLRNTARHQLDNGMTVLLLPDRSFPVVSVQMLYRAGARDEAPGRTGLAHFVEHMAFRGSKHFPGTGLASAIYAVGGEWHGYTYLDQTTYFATAPGKELDLLLRIEADRLLHLDIAADDIPAERGAVLAEMRGYENDPAAVLHDAVIAQAFLAHPYRNNTIGWESDVRAISREDVAAFHARHYRAANAVLAIVGDFEPQDALASVESLFGDAAVLPATPLPTTVEPPQNGERRIELRMPVTRRYFQLTWPAPPATSADYAAFLVLQELLGGGDGVNFLHNEWGTPVQPESLLAAAADEVRTFTMPTAQPYVFAIKGTTAADADPASVEARIFTAIKTLQDAPVRAERLAAARQRVRDALLLDVQTTEDAAHQLAFFAGLHALDALLELPARVAAVSEADVQRLARDYLARDRLTAGWVVPGRPLQAPALGAMQASHETAVAAAAPNDTPAPTPRVTCLTNGLPVILQPSPLSATAHLSLVVAGDAAGLQRQHPVAGHSTFARTVPAEQFPALLDTAAEVEWQPTDATVPATDPYLRMEQVFDRLLPPPPAGAPLLLAVSGQFDGDSVLASLEQGFGSSAATRSLPPPAPSVPRVPIRERIGTPLAAARIGYAVAAPPPGDPAADAWRALLYILSHDYGGRLGDAAISERGLVYYIDARYRSDGSNALVTLSAGVDPEKLGSMETLLADELERLRQQPPSAAEVAEALRHRSGRAVSAAQSNRELADALATDWLWYGELQSPAQLAGRLALVSVADIEAAVPAFTSGVIITVTE